MIEIPTGSKCEICGMDAVKGFHDTSGKTHYYCEHHSPSDQTSAKDYGVFALIIFAIIAATFIFQTFNNNFNITELMRSFMGFFFIVFAGFKILNLKGFAVSYSGYDILAKKFLPYGYLYPFIELTLGICYLLDIQQFKVNIATIIVMSVGSIGVLTELLKKSKIKCACLGTFVKLPLTTVSLIEDLGMGLMALALLLS